MLNGTHFQEAHALHNFGSGVTCTPLPRECTALRVDIELRIDLKKMEGALDFDTSWVEKLKSFLWVESFLRLAFV